MFFGRRKRVVMAEMGNAEESGLATTAHKGGERVLAERHLARLHHWGLQPYGDVLKLQEELRQARQGGLIPDTWLAGEHTTVITQGVRGKGDDLLGAIPYPVFQIDRGGMTTLHNPGQLVIYPIARTQGGMLAQARISMLLLGAVRDWIHEHAGVELAIQKGRPGLFFGQRKVAAIGISIHGRVTMHGIAINLCNDLSPWRAIVPCGEPSTQPMTLSEIAGTLIEPCDLLKSMPEWLRRTWGYERVEKVKEQAALLTPAAPHGGD